MIFVPSVQAQILAWDFQGQGGNESQVAATTKHPQLANSSISRGYYLSNHSNPNTFSASGGYLWVGTKQAAITNENFMTFTISPTSGLKVSLSTLDLVLQRNSFGPNTFQWQYSLDAFATPGVDVGPQWTYSGVETNGLAQPQINLSGETALQVAEGTITLRLYAWGATDNTGRFSLGGLPGNALAIGGFVGQAPVLNTSAQVISLIPHMEGDGPSQFYSFMLTGENFTDLDVTITAPTNYELALDYSGPFTSSVFIDGYNGSVLSVIFRLKGDLAPGVYLGDMTITSPSTETRIVGLVGRIVPIPYGFETADFVFTQDFDDSGKFEYTLMIQNKLGIDVRLKSLMLSFVGKQWAQSADAEALNFSYMISEWPIVEPAQQTWYTNPALDINTVHTGAAGPLNGNDPANQTVTTHKRVSETGVLRWLHYITFKWSHTDSEAALLAVDDLRLSFDTYSVTITNAPYDILMSSPVAEGNFYDFFKNVWIEGFEGSNNPTSLTANIQAYHPEVGFYPMGANLSGTQSGGHGFMYTHKNDDNNDGQPNTSPTVLTVTGPENPDPTFSLAGWHNSGGFIYDGVEWQLSLRGNPFDTAIDWDLLGKQADLSPVIWVWDPFAASYRSWNGSSGDLTNGVIPAFQGFWTASKGWFNMITFTDAARVLGNQFYGKQPDVESTRFAIRGTQGRFQSTAWVEFTETGLMGHDKWDAVSLTPLADNYIHVGTRMNGISYDINTLPLNTQPFELPLVIKSTDGGIVSLTMEEWNMPEGWEISLQDTETGQMFAFGPTFSVDISVPPYVENPMGDPAPKFKFLVVPLPSTSTPDDGRGTMDVFALDQNYPNPFNPSTQIRFTLQSSDVTRLTVYDVVGREVAVLVNGTMPAGSHSVNFDASTLTSGVYVYKLEAGGQVMTKRMTLIK